MQETLRIRLNNPGLVPKVTALIMLAIVSMHSAQAAPIATATSSATVPLALPQSGTNSSTTDSVSSYSSVSNAGNSAFSSAAGGANDSFFAARSDVQGTGTASSTYKRTFSVENNSGEARLYRLDSVITQGGLTINPDVTSPANSDALTSFEWKITSNGTQMALAGGSLRLTNGATFYSGYGDVSLTGLSQSVGGLNGFFSWGSTNVSRNLGLIAANSAITISVELLTYSNASFGSTSYNCSEYGYGYGYGDRVVEVTTPAVCYRPAGYAITRFGDPSNGEFSDISISSQLAPTNVPIPASGLLLALGLGVTALTSIKKRAALNNLKR
jgi:hypothetical protein